MVYVIMVSHGELAPGLHTAVQMIAGERENVFSTSLKDGMSNDEYAENFEKILQNIKYEDKIILLADIIGGSPLTTAVNILNKKRLLPNSRIFGGMNLPMALNVILGGKNVCDDIPLLLKEAQNGIKEFIIENDEITDEDI
ncbi:PTS sugar transporter subunit IIA [Pectinatus sottacetonis]|uniref:PTS sugar transporter subunit IIA n=1 Tax=Pectinatus sottacetonis TaxID=1002795 RepID=UPI0018C74D9A|nr:PTS fructose transporter subunit IIA [Pectinatus sottacetonis]